MKAFAKGTATIDGVRLAGQQVEVISNGDNIIKITYGKYTFRSVKDEFMRLIKTPEDYYCVPEYPKPNSMKAAIVAMHTLWEAKDIFVEGEFDDEEHIEGAVY